ncbi:UNVERIFIED_CONTAM: molybdate transport system permease protein [Acetivibrio alkalicellulosi]
MQRTEATLNKGTVILECKSKKNTQKNMKNNNVELLLLLISAIAVGIYLLFTLTPILSIIKATDFKSYNDMFTNKQNIQSIILSISTSLISLVFTFLLGTPVVYYVTINKKSIVSKIVNALVSIPTVLPPAVAGIGLVLAFGRQGVIGGLLARFGIGISFTPIAVVIAQFFVSSAFFIKIFKAGVESVKPEIIEAAYVFGMGKIEAFIRILIPMLKKNIISGLLVSWTRAMGEFGATIVFAGNVVGRTRTIPLQIYTYMQTDIKSAAVLAVIMFVISFTVLFITELCLKTKQPDV